MEFKVWRPEDTYGPDELNRIEGNTEQLAALIAAAGYPVSIGPVYTERTIESFEFADTLSRVEANIDALHGAFAELPGYIEPKDWAAGLQFDFRDANRLEQNLLLIYSWFGRLVAAFKICGTFRCGQGGRLG